MSATQVSRHVRAPRGAVYRALLDADAVMMGEMRITTVLADKDGGTELTAIHDGLPPGLSASDNELGWRMSLDKLAAFLEGER